MSDNSAAGYTWSADYPEDCPPAGCSEADLTVYRFVKRNPPEPGDFAKPIAQGRFQQQPPPPDKLCVAHALSVFADPADIGTARAIVPVFRRRLVAQGHIGAGDGLVLHSPAKTGTSHHSWWVPEGVDPFVSFQVVDL